MRKKYSIRHSIRHQGNNLKRHPKGEHLESRWAMSGVPAWASYPEADKKIYLDFDGHLFENSRWNTKDLAVIHVAPFDVDGVRRDASGLATFNEDEQSRMYSIWERMKEDFLPFQVDVTTVDPSIAEPGIFQAGDRALRVLFSSKFDEVTGKQWFPLVNNGYCNLLAFRGNVDDPALVFSTHPKGGEIGSHEVGHGMGLSHDGQNLGGTEIEYYSGHGTGATEWSPIMGSGNVLSQWSKGEYSGASNQEDDMGQLFFLLGRRPDDYREIVPLPVGPNGKEVSFEGFIGNPGDTDIFEIEVLQDGTRLRLDIDPWHNGPNLDVGVTLFSLSEGLVVPGRDPVANPVSQLSAHVDVVLPTGTYYLTIDGVGKPAAANDPGYSDYGSVGYYRVTGVLGTTTPFRGDVDQNGLLTAADIDTLFAYMRGEIGDPQGSRPADINGDGAQNQADVDSLVRDVLATEHGDLDLSGRVDFQDFLVLAANFGRTSSTWSAGELTGDTSIDFADFLLLAAHFGFESVVAPRR